MRENNYKIPGGNTDAFLDQAPQEWWDHRTLLEAELKTAKAATPGHPLVNTTDQWTITTLRRALRQAAEAGAEFIAIPHGDTVLRYNPGDTDGMRGFYGSRTSEGIVPKNLRKLLEKIDKDSARPVKTDALDTPAGTRGSGFTLFPLSDKVKSSVVSDGQQLFAFAGERARTADLDALAKARQMEGDGKSREDIWAETGWFRGVDRKWRFEIDDSQSGWNWMSGASEQLDNVGSLGAAYDHQRLFKAYPNLPDLPLGTDAGGAGGRYIGAQSGGPRIDVATMETAAGKPWRVPDDYLRSKLLHEVQHWVQDNEGSSRGGNRKSGVAAYNEISARINRLIDDAGGNLRNAAPEIRQQVEALQAEQKSLPFDPNEYYRRLAGEVEARTVQKRMDMTADQRRARPPWEDYDVPEDQQIVRFANGDGMTAKKPEGMFALNDNAEPRPPLHADMAAVNRLESLKQLAEACAG